MQKISIPVYYFGHIVSVLNDSGYDAEKWLQAQRLSLDDFLAVDASLTQAQFESLLSLVISNQKLSNIGLRVGERLQMSHHGFFGLGLANCDNLLQSFKFLQSFISMRIPGFELQIKHTDSHYSLVVIDQIWRGDLHRTVTDAVMFAIVNAIKSYRVAEGEMLSKVSIMFDYEEPSYADGYNDLGVSSVSFKQGECSIQIPIALMKQAFMGVDRISFLQAETMCRKGVIENNYKPPIDYLVERLLEQCDSAQALSIDEIADSLNVSKRTLHRQLLVRNTSYKKISETLFKKRVSQLLLFKQMSVTQTAYELGYADIANFRRAFKRIMKCTPTEYIKQI